MFSNKRYCELQQLCRGEDHPLLHLYPFGERLRDKSKREVRVVPFFLDEKAPVMLCCPGGAYEFVSWINEGYDIARAFNERGFHVLLLGYRIGAYAKNPNAPNDVAAAMQWIRTHAEAYRLDAENIFLCGFSAGGHLAAYYSATAAKKGNIVPRATVLGYPVISFVSETHERTRELFLGEDKDDPAARAAGSVELIADSTFPPLFTMHCEDDDAVPVSNSLRLAARLKEVGVPCETALYPTGGHGIGVGKGTSGDGWIDKAAAFLRQYMR